MRCHDTFNEVIQLPSEKNENKSIRCSDSTLAKLKEFAASHSCNMGEAMDKLLESWELEKSFPCRSAELNAMEKSLSSIRDKFTASVRMWAEADELAEKKVQQKLQALNARNGELQDRCGQLKKQLDETTADIENLRAQMAVEHEEAQKSRDFLDSMRSQLETANSTIAGLQSSLDKDAATLEEERQRARQLSEEKSALQNALEKERETLQTLRETHTAKLQEKEQVIAGLRETHAAEIREKDRAMADLQKSLIEATSLEGFTRRISAAMGTLSAVPAEPAVGDTNTSTAAVTQAKHRKNS